MSRIHHQSGAVLAIGLILLFVLTLLGLAGAQVTSLEEKMAGNLRQRNLAFQRAESALLNAERFIESNDPAFNPLKPIGGPFQASDCSGGLCPLTNPPKWSVAGFDWASNKTHSYIDTDPASFPVTAKPPRFVLELLDTRTSDGDSSLYATFRITAKGWGDDTNAEVQLQSIYILYRSASQYAL
jgi:type IV pilus assembly protein PilX